jgi:hypothetical protein
MQPLQPEGIAAFHIGLCNAEARVHR